MFYFCLCWQLICVEFYLLLKLQVHQFPLGTITLVALTTGTRIYDYIYSSSVITDDNWHIQLCISVCRSLHMRQCVCLCLCVYICLCGVCVCVHACTCACVWCFFEVFICLCLIASNHIDKYWQVIWLTGVTHTHTKPWFLDFLVI